MAIVELDFEANIIRRLVRRKLIYRTEDGHYVTENGKTWLDVINNLR